jgi:ribosomal protein L6P/L9E
MRELVFQKLKLLPNNKSFSFVCHKKEFVAFGGAGCDAVFSSSLLMSNVFLFSSYLFFVDRRYSFRSIVNRLVNQAYTMLKGLNQVFFFEFRIIGLGYKVYKCRRSLDLKVIFLKLGYSHLIKYVIPKNVRVVTGKRRFLLFGSNLEILNAICRHFFFLKRRNVYKYKGLLLSKHEYKLKQGKKQQR